MADFIVSARKYRPMTFNTVVGQKGLTETLKNAIKTNHLASAYLFSGPRGVGKTTCARIFAKTINCTNRTEDFEACGECESCKSFAEGRSFSIHELDAASNNKVDDIRMLIEKVMTPPQIGSKSVYIIDEVHMLSTAAFNAFLKTLEEPPAYAIFILATTEKHKILPTILSRCQVYDFKRITIDDTIDHLANVAQKEGIEAEDEALAVIAKKADGGMRDALSIFDQVVSFCGNKITYDQVLKHLNVLDFDYYFRFLTHCKNGNVSEVLTIINEVISNGFDEGIFINDYAQHLRNVLMARDPKTVTLLEVSKHAQDQYVDAARDCEEDFLYKSLRIAVECGIQFPTFKNKRLLVELAAIRMCQIMAEKKKLLTEPAKDDWWDVDSNYLKSFLQLFAQNQPVAAQPTAMPQQQYQPQQRMNLQTIQAGHTITTHSIRGCNDEQQQNFVVAVKENKVEREVTKPSLETARINIYNEWRDQQRSQEAGLISTCKFELIDSFKIQIKVPSKEAYQKLSGNFRINLLNALKNHLSNSKIEVQYTIDENVAKEQVLTNKQKFDALLKSSPLVQMLMDELDLVYSENQ